MNESKIKRVVIVGLGSIGAKHLEIVRKLLPDAEIMVLRRNNDHAVPYGANGLFLSLQDACNFKPNIALICNPAPFHIKVAEALSLIGCHIFIEKPLSDTNYDVLNFLEKLKSRSVFLQVGYNMRFLKSLLKVKDSVEDGELGKILSVRASVGQNLKLWRPGTDYRTGVSARSDLGGGVLLELSHELDYLIWIFGRIKWVSAYLGKISNLDIDVEDIGHLIMMHSDDLGKETCISSLTLDFLRADKQRKLEIIGERGTLIWDGIEGNTQKFILPSTDWAIDYHGVSEFQECYLFQLQHFFWSIQNNQQPKTSGADGLAVLELIEAVRLSSSRGGERIYLDPVMKAQI